MRELRGSMPEHARALGSEKIVERVAACAAFGRAASVGLFWPMLERNEVDVRRLDTIARTQNKAVSYPFLEAEGEMTLRIAAPDELRTGAHAFAEPPADAPEAEVDSRLVIIVPALAVDLGGHRIGYGRGLYDRMLARAAPPAFSIAVAFDFQLLAELPRTDADWPVAMVMTDLRECLVP